MDVKTLSAIIGHVSSATTLNIYTHVTDEMQRNAARNIDQGIAGAEVEEEPEREEAAPPVTFTPYRPPHRRPGTGCISQINDHLFEGRYSPTWPNGKRHARNVYAKTRAECEEKLNVLIREMQAERKLLLDQIRGITPPEKLTKKQKQIWEYMRFHPRETNLSAIARGAGVNRHTAAKHYALIREMVGYG